MKGYYPVLDGTLKHRQGLPDAVARRLFADKTRIRSLLRLRASDRNKGLDDKENSGIVAVAATCSVPLYKKELMLL